MSIEITEKNGMFICNEYDNKLNLCFRSYWNRVLDLLKIEIYDKHLVSLSHQYGMTVMEEYYEAIKSKHGKFMENYIQQNGITTRVLIHPKGTNNDYTVQEVMPTVDSFIFPNSLQEPKTKYEYKIAGTGHRKIS